MGGGVLKFWKVSRNQVWRAAREVRTFLGGDRKLPKSLQRKRSDHWLGKKHYAELEEGQSEQYRPVRGVVALRVGWNREMSAELTRTGGWT